MNSRAKAHQAKVYIDGEPVTSEEEDEDLVEHQAEEQDQERSLTPQAEDDAAEDDLSTLDDIAVGIHVQRARGREAVAPLRTVDLDLATPNTRTTPRKRITPLDAAQRRRSSSASASASFSAHLSAPQTPSAGASTPRRASMHRIERLARPMDQHGLTIKPKEPNYGTLLNFTEEEEKERRRLERARVAACKRPARPKATVHEDPVVQRLSKPRPPPQARAEEEAAARTPTGSSAPPRPKSSPAAAVHAGRPLERNRDTPVSPLKEPAVAPRRPRPAVPPTRSFVGHHMNPAMERLAQPRPQPAREVSLSNGKDLLAPYRAKYQSSYGGTTVISPLVASVEQSSPPQPQRRRSPSSSVTSGSTAGRRVERPSWADLRPQQHSAAGTASGNEVHRCIIHKEGLCPANGQPSKHTQEPPFAASLGENMQLIRSMRPRREYSVPPAQVRTTRFVPKDDEEEARQGGWSPLQGHEGEAPKSAAASAEPAVVIAGKRTDMRELLAREVEAEKQRIALEEEERQQQRQQKKARKHTVGGGSRAAAPPRRPSAEEVHYAPRPEIPHLSIPVGRGSPKSVIKKRPPTRKL